MRFLKLLIIISLLIPVVARANLITNGSFETPYVNYMVLPGNSTQISGWTTILHGVEWFDGTSYISGNSNVNGVMLVDLANYIYTGGGIEQTFATVANQHYVLSFYLGTMISSGRDGWAHADVSIAGITQGFDAFITSNTIEMQAFYLPFVATTNTTTVQFTNYQDPSIHFAFLDNVSVESKLISPSSLFNCCMMIVLFACFRGTIAQFHAKGFKQNQCLVL